MTGMDTPEPVKRRWFHVSPDRLVLLLLVVECLLWLSDWLGWWHKGYAVVATIAVVGAALILLLLWFAVAVLFRWRFQFGIRSLLVLAVVVAVPCSWLAVETKKANEQKECVKEITDFNGRVLYDWQLDVDDDSPSEPQPPGSAWLRNLLGVDLFATPEGVSLQYAELKNNTLPRLQTVEGIRSLDLSESTISDSGLSNLTGLTGLRFLDLGRTDITDSGIERLKGLLMLETVSVQMTKITNVGLARLSTLPRLRKVALDYTEITDEGLADLAKLNQLDEVSLEGTDITDLGIKSITNCSHLTYLQLAGTRITDGGVQNLRGLQQL